MELTKTFDTLVIKGNSGGKLSTEEWQRTFQRSQQFFYWSCLNSPRRWSFYYLFIVLDGKLPRWLIVLEGNRPACLQFWSENDQDCSQFAGKQTSLIIIFQRIGPDYSYFNTCQWAGWSIFLKNYNGYFPSESTIDEYKLRL